MIRLCNVMYVDIAFEIYCIKHSVSNKLEKKKNISMDQSFLFVLLIFTKEMATRQCIKFVSHKTSKNKLWNSLLTVVIL